MFSGFLFGRRKRVLIAILIQIGIPEGGPLILSFVSQREPPHWSTSHVLSSIYFFGTRTQTHDQAGALLLSYIYPADISQVWFLYRPKVLGSCCEPLVTVLIQGNFLEFFCAFSEEDFYVQRDRVEVGPLSLTGIWFRKN